MSVHYFCWVVGSLQPAANGIIMSQCLWNINIQSRQGWHPAYQCSWS